MATNKVTAKEQALPKDLYESNWGGDSELSGDDDSSISSGGLIKETASNSGDVEIREARILAAGDNNSIQVWRNVILFMVRSHLLTTCICLSHLTASAMS